MEPSAPRTRMLTVERTGDSWALIPRLRICGKWFEQAGFKPGSRVSVHLLEPGLLQIKATPPEQGKPTTPPPIG